MEANIQEAHRLRLARQKAAYAANGSAGITTSLST